MDKALAILLFVGYLYGAGRLIRWASARADQETPDWFSIVGMLIWPRVLGRAAAWLTPNEWGWPERWLELAVQLLALFLILWLYFRLRLVAALLIWILILALGIWMVIQMLPLLPGTRAG